MKDKILLQQLRQLNQVKPRDEWKNSFRDILLSKIHNDVVDSQSFKQTKMEQALTYVTILIHSFSKNAMQPAVVLVAMFVLVLGTSFTVNAAFYSLPGQKLYNLKIGLVI